ncbi:MAG: AAA family ATPase [Candidatus Poribacteria bacterium]|nr:AAA family ATPase [Candidatus Poribacteria bacterium]
MKLCKLKIKNLNSFRGEVVIDFEESPLNDASLVAITGPTGSGKTTILDAICVALYGKTPRLTGSSTRNPKNLISHGEKECSAEVHFLANETRYIAVWEGKKKGSPKGSLKIVDSNELITEKLSNKGKAMGDSESTVSDEITSILGLDFEAFTRSVMLAQGEFAAFLKSLPEDRREILEATAGIHIYDKLKEALNAKVNQVSDEYNEIEYKLNQIPDATTEILEEEIAELTRLKSEAEKLGGRNQQILKEKETETERTDEYNKLQSSQEQQKELENQQHIIDNIKAELKLAEYANQLRPEKQAYDSAKSEHEQKSVELQNAKTEHDEAQKQIETNKTDFENKDNKYNTELSNYNRKTKTYNSAIIDINQANTNFDQANQRITKQKEINDQLETSQFELSHKETLQYELQTQIEEANSFITDNPLPSDRNHRLTRVSNQLTELRAHRKNLKAKNDSQTEQMSNIDELDVSIKELTNNKDKLLTEKVNAKNTYNTTQQTLEILQDTGSIQYWQEQRSIAINALQIAQEYEIKNQQIHDITHDVTKLQKQISTFDESLDEIESNLKVQIELCKRIDAKVKELEEERKNALLANPINLLRQQLENGKPCKVCGATDHPFSNNVEIDCEDHQNIINQKLLEVQTEAENAQDKKTNLENERIRITQNIRNYTEQCNEHSDDIKNLNTEIHDLQEQWKKLYQSENISQEWVEKRMKDADITIESFTDANNAIADTKNDLQIISQKLDTCERDLNKENGQLIKAKQNLEVITIDIEDLKSDISGTKKRFWELIPVTFHNITADEAVKQFRDSIDKIETCEDNLSTYNTKFEVNSTEIQNIQDDIDRLEGQKNQLQKEIEYYQNEGGKYLNTVRVQTDGLESEDEIRNALNSMETELQQQKNKRDKAETLLQKSRDILTQKQTSYRISEQQLHSTLENLKNTKNAYFVKLNELGFKSPEDHDKAFRDEDKIQEIEMQITHYNQESQQLQVEIKALRSKFDDSPYVPDLLPEIINIAEEIAEEIQKKQQQIGAQQQIIDELKENLKKREEINDELQSAKNEMERWQRLQETIHQNKLRDFALDITFQQVSRIANEHLKYLTSERYQLKVETIGKLSVIDRWNANEERPVETLSGGESFLTSMALALALSELSQGRAQLNSLFLDEGFGTLDTETLEIAIAALEGLRMQGRSIFIISHIQELTKRLPVKINVRKRGNGSSTIDIK